MSANQKTWLFPVIAILAGPAVVPGHAAMATDAVVRPQANTFSTQVKSFPRLLSGDGWQSTIVLMDLGATPISFRQSFLGNDGTAASLNVHVDGSNTDLTASALQGTVGANGSVSYQLTSSSSSLQEAWSLLTFEGASNQLSGYATLRHVAAGGGFNFEVTLPLNGMQDSSSRLPFDNSNGSQTQLTLVNPASNLSAQVSLTYFNTQGQAILLDSLTLKPGAQTTLVLPNTYPDLANLSGTVAIQANINVLSVSGLRLNPSTGAIAAIPVMDFTPAASPVIVQ